MPGQFLSAAERERLEGCPREIAERDLNTFFTLSAADSAELPSHSAPQHRLGFALQLCGLRSLGFSPLDLTTAPAGAVASIADQLDLDPASLARYGLRAPTRRDHFQRVVAYRGFRKAGPEDLRSLETWLVERALEHDRPTLLLQLACERLRQEQLVRPGITSLERLVVAARTNARGGSGLGPCDGSLGAEDCPVSGVPHSRQNLVEGRFAKPHCGQRIWKETPHSPQNLVPSGLSTLQLAQRMDLLYSFKCAGAGKTLFS
jgi:hypothetical protein